VWGGAIHRECGLETLRWCDDRREAFTMDREDSMVAPCGIDCRECDIFRAPREPEIMDGILKWFQEERGLTLRREDIRCGGCLGDRSVHWSADCPILQCAVDDNGLRSCVVCGRFPCGRLEEWAGDSDGHREALDRLKDARTRLPGSQAGPA